MLMSVPLGHWCEGKYCLQLFRSLKIVLSYTKLLFLASLIGALEAFFSMALYKNIRTIYGLRALLVKMIFETIIRFLQENTL